ncbi:MAG: ATP-binding protein [Bryobacteraceae bacterium]|nr:ATP-binding protein [Bryobacteraceae bacterium]
MARRFAAFTTILCLWIVLVALAHDAAMGRFDFWKGALLTAVVAGVGLIIGRFTVRLLVRPLEQFREGLAAVREGRLTPIPVNRTSDEMAFLGESFNRMIEQLSASQQEVRRHQELLEQRIRERTEALEVAMKRALAASEAKSEFLANVSHELRTPMSGLLGMLDILLDGDLRAEQRDQVETAQNCANSLLALLNDILDHSKIEAGKMILEQIPFDPRGLLEECVKALAGQARKKGIEVRCELGDDVPASAVGDPLRIRQIVNNLLNNAVKFTERGWVRLAASAQAGDDGVTLTIAVEDTGVGIPEEKLGTIFEKFTQADGSTSRRYGGTGLGLAITQRLVTMHGGRIEVESEAGRGATFRVTVLLGKAGSTAAAQGAEPRLRSQGSLQVLVVEDNLVNQRVITALLKKNGYAFTVACNGVEALAALEQGEFGLVLMDVQMPVMDGLEATRRIRQRARWRHLPVVAMTAHAMTGDRDRCLQSGMNAYLAKPVNAAQLMGMVDSYLRMSTAQPLPLREPKAKAPTPINEKLAAQRLGSHPALLQGMQQLFLEFAPEQVQRLKLAAGRRDTGALEREAGQVRTAAEHISATQVEKCASEIAAAAAVGRLEQVQADIGRLEQELTRLSDRVAGQATGEPSTATAGD